MKSGHFNLLTTVLGYILYILGYIVLGYIVLGYGEIGELEILGPHGQTMKLVSLQGFTPFNENAKERILEWGQML